jgi:glycosyltransferase involved in cell wall biosynthesis
MMNRNIHRKKIKICNVDEEGRFGGPERRIIQVAKALSSYNVDTVILFPKLDSGVFRSKIAEAGVHGVSWPMTRLSKEKKILIRYALFFWLEILGYIVFFKKRKIELVHVNGSYQFKVAIAARLAGAPVVWHLNDTFAPSILRRVFHAVAPLCAKGFIIAGKRVGSYYLDGTALAKKPVMEIHAPVDMSFFDPSRYPEETEDDKRKDVVIGTVSGVNPAKGLEYFIDAAGEILKTCPGARFMVAGAVLSSQKKYYEMIQEKLGKFDPEKIEFCGLIDDVPGFLSKLDICLFSSVTEASPTSIWEAMAMAKPVVTTDVGSVTQYIKDGESGFIVPVGDSRKLAERTVELINHPGMRKKFALAARKSALKNLDITSAARKHEEIYRKILQNK